MARFRPGHALPERLRSPRPLEIPLAGRGTPQSDCRPPVSGLPQLPPTAGVDHLRPLLSPLGGPSDLPDTDGPRAEGSSATLAVAWAVAGVGRDQHVLVGVLRLP